MQYILFSSLCLLLLISISAFKTPFTNPAFNRNMKSMALAARLSGKVKFFDSVKGYGFIIPDDGSADLFVHQTAVHARGYRSLAEGETVEFDVNEDPERSKRFASNVTGPNGEYVIGSSRPAQRGYSNDRNSFSNDRNSRGGGYGNDYNDQ